jgi:hypothetical protein
MKILSAPAVELILFPIAGEPTKESADEWQDYRKKSARELSQVLPSSKAVSAHAALALAMLATLAAVKSEPSCGIALSRRCSLADKSDQERPAGGIEAGLRIRRDSRKGNRHEHGGRL